MQHKKPAHVAGFFIGERGRTDLSFAAFSLLEPEFHLDSNAK
jgi:hypothetical protein